MRNLKSLLILTLDKFESEEKQLGLCFAIKSLHINSVISHAEHEALRFYILSNPPKGLIKISREDNIGQDSYFWRAGLDLPRKQWLNKHIKLNQLNIK